MTATQHFFPYVFPKSKFVRNFLDTNMFVDWNRGNKSVRFLLARVESKADEILSEASSDWWLAEATA